MRANLNRLIKTGFAGLILCFYSFGCSDILTNGADNGLKKVSLKLVWEFQSQFSGYLVAKEKGFYKENGLDVTINEGHAEGNLVSLVAAGIDTFGVAQLDNIVMNVDNGKDVRAIAQIFQHNNQLILAKKNSGINSLSDFRNKTYSTWSGANDLMLRILLLKENISTPNIKVLPFNYWTVEDFLSGTAKLIKVMKYNEYNRIIEQGVSPHALTIFDFKDFGLDVPEDAIYVARSFLEKQPDICASFVNASIRGWKYALQHPDEAVQILKKYAGRIDEVHERYMLDTISKSVEDFETDKYEIGYFDIRRIDDFLTLLYAKGQLQNKLNASDVINASFTKRVN